MHHHPHPPLPGAIPLERVADALDDGRRRMAAGMATLILVPLGGCVLLAGPVMIVDKGLGVWLGVLVGVLVLAAITAGMWLGLRRYRDGRRAAAPGFRAAWLVGNHIDLTSADGSRRTLSLHAPDLRLERPAPGAVVAIDQLVLAGSGHDGRSVAVVLAHRRRKLTYPTYRQPHPVFVGVIAAAERSPHQAGRVVAAQLRQHLSDGDAWHRRR